MIPCALEQTRYIRVSVLMFRVGVWHDSRSNGPVQKPVLLCGCPRTRPNIRTLGGIICSLRRCRQGTVNDAKVLVRMITMHATVVRVFEAVLCDLNLREFFAALLQELPRPKGIAEQVARRVDVNGMRADGADLHPFPKLRRSMPSECDRAPSREAEGRRDRVQGLEGPQRPVGMREALRPILRVPYHADVARTRVEELVAEPNSVKDVVVGHIEAARVFFCGTDIASTGRLRLLLQEQFHLFEEKRAAVAHRVHHDRRSAMSRRRIFATLTISVCISNRTAQVGDDVMSRVLQ
mmetsp:Transcript_5827/g.15803  ORF Transcript_5827/g.15803 Transcript_5827/m.15803 type:complete len:294 (+) Transcript_5827:940-1821(+)